MFLVVNANSVALTIHKGVINQKKKYRLLRQIEWGDTDLFLKVLGLAAENKKKA